MDKHYHSTSQTEVCPHTWEPKILPPPSLVKAKRLKSLGLLGKDVHYLWLKKNQKNPDLKFSPQKNKSLYLLELRYLRLWRTRWWRRKKSSTSSMFRTLSLTKIWHYLVANYCACILSKQSRPLQRNRKPRRYIESQDIFSPYKWRNSQPNVKQIDHLTPLADEEPRRKIWWLSKTSLRRSIPFHCILTGETRYLKKKLLNQIQQNLQGLETFKEPKKRNKKNSQTPKTIF